MSINSTSLKEIKKRLNNSNNKEKAIREELLKLSIVLSDCQYILRHREDAKEDHLSILLMIDQNDIKSINMMNKYYNKIIGNIKTLITQTEASIKYLQDMINYT